MKFRQLIQGRPRRYSMVAASVVASAAVVSGLAVSGAQAKTITASAPAAVPVSCAYEGNGYTGGTQKAGSDWYKKADNCANFWLIVAYNTATDYRGWYRGSSTGGRWVPAAEGPYYCAAGAVCNDKLATNVAPGTELTVNSSNNGGGPGGAHILVGY